MALFVFTAWGTAPRSPHKLLSYCAARVLLGDAPPSVELCVAVGVGYDGNGSVVVGAVSPCLRNDSWPWQFCCFKGWWGWGACEFPCCGDNAELCYWCLP